MINDTIDPFIKAYRESLDRQRDLASQGNLSNRDTAQASIMANANNAGMMYSNFPTREKIKFDTEHIMPRMVKIQQGYQTGVDKLRQNTIELSNQLKEINEAIADLNEA